MPLSCKINKKDKIADGSTSERPIEDQEQDNRTGETVPATFRLLGSDPHPFVMPICKGT